MGTACVRCLYTYPSEALQAHVKVDVHAYTVRAQHSRAICFCFPVEGLTIEGVQSSRDLLTYTAQKAACLAACAVTLQHVDSLTHGHT